MAQLPTPAGYVAWLADLKAKIRDARLRTALAVNSELIMLYWQDLHAIPDARVRIRRPLA